MHFFNGLSDGLLSIRLPPLLLLEMVLLHQSTHFALLRVGCQNVKCELSACSLFHHVLIYYTSINVGSDCTLPNIHSLR
jgi:hypothetical protein